jgi:PAS domain S-box-containing protein/diguanylate cyclase (GGDEF)-like protein
MPDQENLPLLDVTILYVEDDEVTRKGIAEFLGLRVQKVIVAEDGQQGLEYYKEHHPDMIITDIKMPVMNGIDMAKTIKLINKDIPFIVTTAYNDVEFLIECIDLGINQFILKPIVGNKLMEAIHKCMRGYSLEQELVQIAGLLSEYKNAIDASSIVFKFDTKGNITYVNDAICKTSGFSKDQLIGKKYQFIRSDDDNEYNKEDLIQILSEKKTWRGVTKNRTSGGSIYYVNNTIVPISDVRGSFVEFMSIGYEVTELINKEEELLKQLYTDRTTNLPNRTKLLEDVEKSSHPILMLVNIDSFQQINDFYGNEIGDYLIIEIGKRMRGILPTKEFNLYKMPADEYAILIDKEINIKELEPFIQLSREEINEKPFIYLDNAIHITAAFGVAVGKESAKPDPLKGKWHSLALNADMALKKAKRTQKQFIIYDESMQISKEYEYNIKWTRKLKEAIKENRIVPYFQPILNNHTKTIDKFECLVRMIDKDGMVHAPILFLDLAKKSKLYHSLTKIMIKKSLEVFKDTDYEFSINLSVDDILDEETNHFIKATLNEYHKVAPRLVFEILESEGIENYEEVKNFIQEIKEFKCKLAIDDFGSGYSNFSHILRLNVDYLKIDASLTKQIHKDRNTQIIAQTIVDFTKKLGIKTIAEFVHNKEIFDKIMELGVDYSQGYYFGEPKVELIKTINSSLF